jgi:hypothetical protein
LGSGSMRVFLAGPALASLSGVAQRTCKECYDEVSCISKMTGAVRSVDCNMAAAVQGAIIGNLHEQIRRR